MTLNGKLHLAPIEKDPHHVLDIGTGTGIVSIQIIGLNECDIVNDV